MIKKYKIKNDIFHYAGIAFGVFVLFNIIYILNKNFWTTHDVCKGFNVIQCYFATMFYPFRFSGGSFFGIIEWYELFVLIFLSFLFYSIGYFLVSLVYYILKIIIEDFDN